MCGICGFISKKKVSVSILDRMNNTLCHRGPDDSGSNIFSYEDYQVGLAHRRLSIIDLSKKGHQPMFSNDRKAVVVFNGEIYNFEEIKKQLGNEYEFCTACDTEVVLASYQKWGDMCFSHFDGMFAIAIYDIQLHKLILSRDRIGKKPLYYFCSGDDFVFASELKAIMEYDFFEKEIRKDVLGEYLFHGYIQGEKTIFQNVYKLPPGTVLVIQNENISKKTFWSVEESFADQQGKRYPDYEQAKNEIKELLENAVKKRMVADVPVGVYLSGGIDSTLIAAIMQKYSNEKIRTYTIGFNEKNYDEAQHAKAIAQYLGTEHEEKYIDEAEMINFIQQIPRYFDDPVADPAVFPTFILSKMAQHAVKVVLTGDGGDELFCGYRQYENVAYFRKLDWTRFLLPSKKFLYEHMGKVTSRMYALKNNDNKLCKTQWINGIDAKIIDSMLLEPPEKELRYPIEGQFHTKDWVRKRMLVDTKTTLADDFLVKTDRTTMAYSLEARCPLLDTALIQKTFQLPLTYLKEKENRKKMLKDILTDYIPEELWNRPKHSFAVPISKWLRGGVFSELLKFADKERLIKQGLFNADCINRLIDELQNGKKNIELTAQYLWRFLIFQLWYKCYIEDLWET